MNHLKHVHLALPGMSLSEHRAAFRWTLVMSHAEFQRKLRTKRTQRTPSIVVGNLNESFKLRTEKARAAEGDGPALEPTSGLSCSILKKIFIYLSWLCWVCCCADFSLVTVSLGSSSWRCVGFSLQWLLIVALGCTSFSRCSSWALEHRLSSCGTWT